MKISIEEVKKNLKYLAKEFDLNYDNKWFNFILVSKREITLNDFITGCPASDYEKFGKSSKTRINNLDKFLKSREYKEMIRGVSGCIKLKKDFKKELNLGQLIRHKDVQREYLNIFKRAKQEFKDNILALVTKPKTKGELKYVLQILTHEWLHILLMKNKIWREDFGLFGRKYWLVDEGLVTYFDAFLGKYISKLEIMKKRERPEISKSYLSRAIKWKKILKGKTDPKERKKAISDYYKDLANANKI